MKRTTALLLAFALALGVVHAATGNGDPATVTNAAYQTALKHFGFSPKTLRPQLPYLSPDLYAALLKKANLPTPAGDAPDIEGEVLFNAQDVPTKWEVGTASVNGVTAVVPVSLSWDSEKRRYLVHLAQIKGNWKITDIDYGKDGKLMDLLK